MRIFGHRPQGGGEDPVAAGLASVAAMEQDGLPLGAKARIEAALTPGAPFTSTLSVSDLMLLERLGIEPVGQVMGSAFYHLGLMGMLMGSGELTSLTRASYDARSLAIERMRDEAERLGAHGVVAMHLVRRAHEWSGDLVEFTAMGTAVRLRQRIPGVDLFMAGMDLPSLAKLMAHGQLPVGVAIGLCVYAFLGNWRTTWAAMSMNNQEMTDLTEMVYRARGYAMQRMRSDARELGAAGIAGCRVDLGVTEIETQNSMGGEQSGWVLEFVALGDALRPIDSTGGDDGIRPGLDLGDHGKGEGQ